MCMGPPCRSYWLLPVSWVYPHVYGATHKRIDSSPSILGLSPCVWGHWSYPVLRDSYWHVVLVLVRYCFSKFFWGRYPISERHRSEEHTSELQSRGHIVCRLLHDKQQNNGRNQQV